MQSITEISERKVEKMCSSRIVKLSEYTKQDMLDIQWRNLFIAQFLGDVVFWKMISSCHIESGIRGLWGL